MIYKFIDNNGSEITVNSISSLQALVDSETVKKDTKVKAGLRGKWTTANNIPELDFEEKKEETIDEITEPEEDIKTFISKPEIKDEPKEEITTKKTDDDEYEYVEEIVEEVIEVDDIEKKEQHDTKDGNAEEPNDYYTDQQKKDFSDEKVIGLNFFDAIKICFKKYLVVEGRASRSEYWWFILFGILFDVACELIDYSLGYKYGEFGLFFFISLITLIPSVTVAIRRLHDVNKSGWWVLLPFTIIGLIPLFIWNVSKGTEGKNRFGEYPLKLKRK